MANPILKARAASFVDEDGAEVQYTTGPLPDDVPAEHLDALREQGAIAEADEPTALDVTAAADAAGRPALDSVMHVDPDPAEAVEPGQHETSELYAGAESGTPSGSSSGSGPSADLPDDAPDAAQADVGELAAYIDAESLNAAQTVSLAEGDPALAAKVLEAERVAHGDDARSTVERPLSKLAAKAEGGDTGGDTPPAG